MDLTMRFTFLLVLTVSYGSLETRAAAQVAQNVIFTENFSQDYQIQFVKHGGCHPHSFAMVNDPNGGSNSVFKVTTIMGQDNRTCTSSTWNQPLSGYTDKYKHRSEIVPKNKNIRFDSGVDYWVEFRTYVPNSYPSGDDLINFHITQVIPSSGSNGFDSSLQIDAKGRWQYALRSSPVRTSKHTSFDLGSIKRGRWTQWKWHIKRHESNGVAELWKDGVQVVAESGRRTSQMTSTGALWKLGMYNGVAVADRYYGQTYVVYFDDVQVSKGSEQVPPPVLPKVQVGA